ncbi:nucleoside-diphosphate-sugar epimerase [Trinickia symbiotica]|uniref:NAD-dependent epimerase n=1 Tax=Trinickia symbiotica TaxID=863227 RepID=A0A2N7X3H1_9BURK|nr:D-erythronate dehydrogenase [Trinickia symbiotica]PMS36308.1 NAD-dependent epimerase [Trinickia symbiotica]PPK44890.1 nucleoside-diphosphate-sugar epimerase [Trinickia symbiotica]
MKVLITGGAGFLGQRLARKLLERGILAGPDGKPQPISQLVLLDVAAAPDMGDARVCVHTGDISQRDVLEAAIDSDTYAIFHLAAIVSGQAEADFELGMRINFDASRLLLDICRARGHRPRVVFASSVAVYGGTLPDVVGDDTALNPQSSYGTQKAMTELMVCDYARRGFIEGRAVRLPTISVRPGRPNAAASSFASGIVREPLAGVETICPVEPRTRLWLLSPRAAIDALIGVYELEQRAFGDRPVLNLPGLSVSVEEMVDALREVAGDAIVSRIIWRRDERIERIVASWPGRCDASRAESLGLRGDRTFADVIRAYLHDDARRV